MYLYSANDILQRAKTDLVSRALAFGEAAYSGVEGKYGRTLLGHSIDVAGIVSTVEHDDMMLAAAILHDVKDNKAVTDQVLVGTFGEMLAEWVWYLHGSDDCHVGVRADRTAAFRRHIERACAQVKTVKVADNITNVSTIVDRDARFAKLYLKEKLLELEATKGGDQLLWARAHALCVQQSERLAELRT